MVQVRGCFCSAHARLCGRMFNLLLLYVSGRVHAVIYYKCSLLLSTFACHCYGCTNLIRSLTEPTWREIRLLARLKRWDVGQLNRNGHSLCLPPCRKRTLSKELYLETTSRSSLYKWPLSLSRTPSLSKTACFLRQTKRNEPSRNCPCLKLSKPAL